MASIIIVAGSVSYQEKHREVDGSVSKQSALRRRSRTSAAMASRMESAGHNSGGIGNRWAASSGNRKRK
jgi:hypothetical protein